MWRWLRRRSSRLVLMWGAMDVVECSDTRSRFLRSRSWVWRNRWSGVRAGVEINSGASPHRCEERKRARSGQMSSKEKAGAPVINPKSTLQAAKRWSRKAKKQPATSNEAAGPYLQPRGRQVGGGGGRRPFPPTCCPTAPIASRHPGRSSIARTTCPKPCPAVSCRVRGGTLPPGNAFDLSDSSSPDTRQSLQQGSSSEPPCRL